MGPIATQESQKVAFHGECLTILGEYVPSRPKSEREMRVWAALEAYLSDEVGLEALFAWTHSEWATISGSSDEGHDVTRVLGTLLGYERQCIPGAGSRLLYSFEEVRRRILDVRDWMALGSNKTLLEVQKSGPLPLSERVPSLLEQDIRVKLGEYLASQMVLPELIGWLENPLLLWEMLAQAGTDPVFYEWVMSLHRILAFYTESRDTREQEVYDLLSRLAQA